MAYRLVATDIDGTLLNPDKTASEATREAIAALRARSIPVVLVTGRPLAMALRVHQQLGLVGPVIACTGALLYDPHQSRVLAHRFIPREIALRAVAAIRRVAPTTSITADLEDEWHLDRIEDERHYRLTGGMIPILGGVERTIPHSTREVTAISFRPMSIRTQVEEAFQQDGLTEHLHTTSASQVVDIIATGVNKGAALERLTGLLGIPLTETAALGDDENDLPLLQAAGLGIAMGNAPDSVKAVAAATTGPNTADGWAEAIWRHVLDG